MEAKGAGVVRETWEGFCDIWSTQRWKELSAKNLQIGEVGSPTVQDQQVHIGTASNCLGRERTYAELYLQLHASKGDKRKGKGKAKEGSREVVVVNENEDSGNQESNDASGITESLTFDDKSREVYERALLLNNDPANCDKSEAQIWIMASGGPSHGRIYGFGSKIDKAIMPTSSTHSRPICYLPAKENAEPKMYSAQEIEAIIQERDRRYRKDRAAREQVEAKRNKQNNMMFEQLFAPHGLAMPTLEVMPTASASQECEDRDRAIHEEIMEAAEGQDHTEVQDHTQVPNQSIQPGYVNWFAGTGLNPNAFFTGV